MLPDQLRRGTGSGEGGSGRRHSEGCRGGFLQRTQKLLGHLGPPFLSVLESYAQGDIRRFYPSSGLSTGFLQCPEEGVLVVHLRCRAPFSKECVENLEDLVINGDEIRQLLERLVPEDLVPPSPEDQVRRPFREVLGFLVEDSRIQQAIQSC